MKIYTLVRTELHNDTNIWHFPTLSMAQGKMCDECTEIVGQHCSLNSTTKTTYWDCEVAEYYAICSNGNKIEFEIIEKDIELREFIIHTIADRVVELNEVTNCYYDVIYDSIDNLDASLIDGCLPKMTTKEIDHYIYCELFEFMSNRAADIVCENQKSDYMRQVTIDYIENNCKFDSLVRILNYDLSSIDEIKLGVNEVEGEEIFHKEYVYVYKSSWDDGRYFDSDESINIFKNHAAAVKCMEEDQERVVDTFNQMYSTKDITIEKNEDKTLVYVKDGCIEDLWIGTITKMYVCQD